MSPRYGSASPDCAAPHPTRAVSLIQAPFPGLAMGASANSSDDPSCSAFRYVAKASNARSSVGPSWAAVPKGHTARPSPSCFCNPVGTARPSRAC
eukprot:15057988-Alexandrium_andersonii.AAC.1